MLYYIEIYQLEIFSPNFLKKKKKAYFFFFYNAYF